jgi:hypothetical protein
LFAFGVNFREKIFDRASFDNWFNRNWFVGAERVSDECIACFDIWGVKCVDNSVGIGDIYFVRLLCIVVVGFTL